MWQVTFDGLFYGKGAAIGILLLISVAVLIIPYIRYTLRTEAQQ
jgi:glucose/mannose transport system permease protein